jgi:putative alpha-1,2-mannosidase
VLGTPMFPKATLRFADGRTLLIRGNGTGPYVQKVTLNGNPLNNSWLPLTALGPGTSELTFSLAEQPDKQRGKREDERPPSFRQP